MQSILPKDFGLSGKSSGAITTARGAVTGNVQNQFIGFHTQMKEQKATVMPQSVTNSKI